ncbi:ATP-binding protein [Ferrimonas lipolytica]|uniref:Anti-sigma regulatory factor n=1 Tax=Ferrimonas lipolytica TaxID=2724191 RepID=A0A6H1UGG3_9GAMM|nr:ATP-binding protein [Ferrimonas lipolytica]QIZ77690.1 anti-sigma regulatory factor [Ferrimonas lipolytica]
MAESGLHTISESHPVSDEASFQGALLEVKRMLQQQGFDSVQSAKFLTAVSELARNIIKYAGNGWLELTPLNYLNRTGIQVEAIDFGNGIANIEQAMQEHFSSGGTLGQGLPGTRRLVDEFNIKSSSQGTRVTVRSWC